MEAEKYERIPYIKNEMGCTFAPPGAMQDSSGRVFVTRNPNHDSAYWWSSKPRTKDCTGCRYLVDTEAKDFCGWGVAGKELFDIEKPRKCNLLSGNRTPEVDRRGFPTGMKRSLDSLNLIADMGWSGRFLEDE